MQGWRFWSPHASPNTFWANSARFYPTKGWDDRSKVPEWNELIDSVEIIERGTRPGDFTYDPVEILAEEDPGAVARYEHQVKIQQQLERDIEALGENFRLIPEEEDIMEACIALHDDWQDLLPSALSAAHARNTTPSVREALTSANAHLWKEAVRRELEGLEAMGTWEITDLPDGIRPIDSKLVLKIKSDDHGVPLKYKARLVARGFTQQEGIDHEETFSPVAPYTAIRAVLALAVVLVAKGLCRPCYDKSRASWLRSISRPSIKQTRLASLPSASVTTEANGRLDLWPRPSDAHLRSPKLSTAFSSQHPKAHIFDHYGFPSCLPIDTTLHCLRRDAILPVSTPLSHGISSTLQAEPLPNGPTARAFPCQILWNPLQPLCSLSTSQRPTSPKATSASSCI